MYGEFFFLGQRKAGEKGGEKQEKKFKLSVYSIDVWVQGYRLGLETLTLFRTKKTP